MIGLIVVLGFCLIGFILVLSLMARNEGQSPMVTKTLREIEQSLMAIQNHSDDVYARGKASECVDKVRRVLDGQ